MRPASWSFSKIVNIAKICFYLPKKLKKKSIFDAILHFLKNGSWNYGILKFWENRKYPGVSRAPCLKIAGVDEFLTSNKLILRPMRFPHAPTIKAEVTGLLERRQLESDLIYELRSWNQMLSEILVDSSSEYTNTNIEQNYRQMGEILTKIAQFTGELMLYPD